MRVWGLALSAERVAAEGVTGVTHVTPVITGWHHARLVCFYRPVIAALGPNPDVTAVTLVTLPDATMIPASTLSLPIDAPLRIF